MKEKLRSRIRELTSLIGISGCEWDVSRYIYGVLDGHVDSLELLPNGALIAVKRGGRPGVRRVLSAHMDEVGYSVRTIDARGFLHFDKVGGATEACMPGRRVLVKGRGEAIPGVIGVRSAHVASPQELAKAQTVDESYVDIGVSSREEALALGIGTGAQIVPDSPCAELHDPDIMTSRAIDCRVLCAIIIETMLRLGREDFAGEICAVFSVMEETTIMGVMPAINKLLPTYGLFLDTIPTNDVPGGDTETGIPLRIGGGPAVLVSQQLARGFRRAVAHPKLLAALEELAARDGIPYQAFAYDCGSMMTDASAAAHSGYGTATATLGVPRRYSHSPVELINLNDAVGAQRLTEAFIRENLDISML